MTPQMQEALYRLSTCYDPDPSVIFQQVVETVAELYDGTMAMINLTEGDCIRYRAVINPPPIMRRLRQLELQNTF